MSPLPRRQALAAIGSTALAASAGCLVDVHDAVTSVKFKETESPLWRRWLPAPAALPGDSDGYDVSYLRVADLRGPPSVARAGRGLRNLFARTGRDPLGLADRVEAVVKLQLTTATVLLGDFGDASLGAVARRAGYRETGEHRDYTLYERADGTPGEEGHAVAARAGAIVLSVANAPVETLTTVVDASHEINDRYHETDDRFRRLTDAAGAPTMAWLHPGSAGQGIVDGVDSVVGTAHARQFTQTRVRHATHLLFTDGRTPTVKRLRRSVEHPVRLRSLSTSLDVSVDGRLGRVEYALPLDAASSEEPLLPLTAWRFDHDSRKGTLSIAHQAGDPVDPQRLSIRVGTSEAPSPFGAKYERVEPGDAVSVDVRPGDHVRLVWSAGDSMTTLASFQVPAGDD